MDGAYTILATPVVKLLALFLLACKVGWSPFLAGKDAFSFIGS